MSDLLASLYRKVSALEVLDLSTFPPTLSDSESILLQRRGEK